MPEAEGPPPAPETPVHERLLEAARELFAADGYESASTSAVARRAGTSESQLIKHFGSKEGLLEAVFDQGWRALETRVRQALDKTASPLERFRALGRSLVEGLAADRRVLSLMLLEGRRVRKRGRDVVLSRGFRDFVRQVDAVLGQMRSAGQLRPDVPLEAVRSALMGAMEGLLRDRLMAELIVYPATYSQKEVLAAFEAVLGGFLTPAAVRSLQRPGRAATRRPRPGRRTPSRRLARSR